VSAPSVSAPPAAADGAGADGAPGDRPALDLPRDTTPTWEIELLVSGAVLFGLFQIPPALYALWDRWEPHLATLGRVTGTTALLIGTTSVYGLIGCFVAHLALRAYWVALVGAHSVFPGGVRWERQREFGPIQARLAQRSTRPLPEFIARADNTASLVFAAGFVCAASVLSVVVVLGAMLAFLGAMMQLLPERAALYVGLGVGGLFAAGMMIAVVVDYRFGARLAPDGRVARALMLLMRPSVSAVPAGVRSLSGVLMSNVPKRVAYAAMAVAVGGAYGVGLANMPDHRDAIPGAGNYRYFDGAASTRGVNAHHYDALRGADGDPSVPSIQSEVVRDPYLRLFVPYRPARHNAALAAACPGLRRADADAADALADSDADAILACAARVHRPALDGRPISRASFRFYQDPTANRRGFVMMVPLDGVPAGEHRVTVWPVPAPGREPPRVPFTIPFWR
jgi:hypothetical protein